MVTHGEARQIKQDTYQKRMKQSNFSKRILTSAMHQSQHVISRLKAKRKDLRVPLSFLLACEFSNGEKL